MKIDYKISEDAFEDLCEYLIAHETDIADGTNDFARLRKVFREVIGREPLATQ